MRSNSIPRLRRHSPSGRAVVTLNGKDHYLGPWPSLARKAPPEVKERYDQLITEWLANNRQPAAPPQAKPVFIVNQLILRYYRWAEGHYRRPDGTMTNEVNDLRRTLRYPKQMFGQLPVEEFTPLKLKAIREKMIEDDLSRGVCNQRVGRIVRMFRWGVSEELVPAVIHQALTTVEGLKSGRSNARETKPIKPVAVALVETTIPCLPRRVAAMVRLQLLTGMRSSEVTTMRGVDLDMSGEIWLYRPSHHKTSYRGRERIIALGPKAQEIVRQYLKANIEAYLFSPRDELVERLALRRKQRKTPLYRSHVAHQELKRSKAPKRQPGQRWTTESYLYAVTRGCRKAHVPHWHPHQLRHTFATEARRVAGLEAAQVCLGHSSPILTEAVYAERDLTVAAAVASRIG